MIGYGMQLAVVEAVRSLLGLNGAHSTEVDAQCSPAVVRIPAERAGVSDSRQQARNGGFDIVLEESRISAIYGSTAIHERHSNRYEIDPAFVAPLKEHGFRFTGLCQEGEYPETFEVSDHPFYMGVIYHPEFISRPNRAHPLFTAFVVEAMKH